VRRKRKENERLSQRQAAQHCMEAGSEVKNYELSRRVRHQHKVTGMKNGPAVLDANL